MNQIRVFKDTKLRANEFAQFTDAEGTRYPQVPRDLLEWADLPEPPADFDDTYTVQEVMDAPYVIFTRKSDEQIAEQNKAKAKAEIEQKERSEMMPRAIREFMLMFMEANATPDKLEGNPGYKKVKAFDTDIKTLRGKL